MDCSLWVESESLLKVKEFKCVGVMFTSESKVDCYIDEDIGLNHFGVERAWLEGRALSLSVSLYPNLHLWS